MVEIRKLKKKLLVKPAPTYITSIPKENLVSSGSKVLNLCCSGRTTGAFAKGMYYNLVGDSDTGKTVEALTVFAEAAINPNFDDYDFILDEPEEGALMNKEVFYGKKTIERTRPPAYDKDGQAKNSESVDNFYDNLFAALERGPCIYILDSMDVLDTSEDQEKHKKQRNARKRGAKEAGTYGTSKAKLNKWYLRKAIPLLKKTGSILFIISQSIDKIGGFGFGDTKTKAGGHSLKFCAALEIWMSPKMKIKRKVLGKDRKVGILTKVRVQKNRLIGRDRTIDLPIYNSFGIDDVGCTIAWLINEGHWKANSEQHVRAKEFGFDGNREDLIKLIQEENKEKELTKILVKVWRKIDEESTVVRKPKYV